MSLRRRCRSRRCLFRRHEWGVPKLRRARPEAGRTRNASPRQVRDHGTNQIAAISSRMFSGLRSRADSFAVCVLERQRELGENATRFLGVELPQPSNARAERLAGHVTHDHVHQVRRLAEVVQRDDPDAS